MSTPQETGSTEIKEYTPSVIEALKTLLAGVGIFAIGVGLVSTDLLTETLVGYFLIPTGLATVGIAVFNRLKAQPRLTLSSEGILFEGQGQTEFAAWPDVGEFSGETRTIAINTFRFIGCYKQEAYEAFKSDEGHGMPTDMLKADISFDISGLKMGRSDNQMVKLVNEINDWRERFRDDSKQATHFSEEDLRTIFAAKADKLKRAKKLITNTGIIGFILVVLIMELS